MNTTIHHLTNTYLAAYTAELATDLRSATSGGRRHGIRRSIARSMVAIGARLSPDSTTVVDGRLVLLEPSQPEPHLQRAA